MKKFKIFIYFLILSFTSNIVNAQTALDFDGINDVVSADVLLNVTNSFTYEAWVYPTDTHEVDAQSIAGFGGLAGQKFLVWPTNGDITYGAGHTCSGLSVGTNGISVYEHAAGYIPALLSVEIPIVGWSHIAVVCDNKSYRLFLNGFLIKVGLISPKTDVHPGVGYSGLGIGGGSYGHYKGGLDNFRIWDYARSQEEILQDMKKCLTGNEPGLVTFYDFEDGTPSTTATDITGNNNATLLNMDTNTDWVYGISCNNLYDIGVTPDSANVCTGDSLIIALDTSESGVFYYLRDDTTAEIIDGPLVGNGDSLFFNTGAINSNKSYNIYSVIDNGVDLPNSDDHIRFNNPFSSYTDQITIESWVNFNDGNHAWAGQTTPELDDMNKNVWLWQNGVFYINDGGTWISLNFPNIPSGWTHVATVAKPSGLYIYYDGVLVDSSAIGISNGIVVNDSSIIDLGHDPRYAAGTIGRNTNIAFDDFRIWNVARSQTAIAANMDLCNFFGNASLVQHTIFDEGIDTRITSLVGSNADIINPSSNWVLGAEGCPTYGIELSQTIKIDTTNHSYFNDTIIACDSVIWVDGITYTSNNDSAQFRLLNNKGCDNIFTLKLTILNSSFSTIDTTIEEGEVYIVNSNSYTVAGTYIDTLVNANGCDSVLTTILNVNPNGIRTAFANNIKIYPNPATRMINIKGVENIDINQIRMLNIIGQDVTNRIIISKNDDVLRLDINELQSGVYYINTAGIVTQIIVGH